MRKSDWWLAKFWIIGGKLAGRLPQILSSAYSLATAPGISYSERMKKVVWISPSGPPTGKQHFAGC